MQRSLRNIHAFYASWLRTCYWSIIDENAFDMYIFYRILAIHVAYFLKYKCVIAYINHINCTLFASNPNDLRQQVESLIIYSTKMPHFKEEPVFKRTFEYFHYGNHIYYQYGYCTLKLFHILGNGPLWSTTDSFYYTWWN